MKTTTKAKRLPADLQTAVDAQFQRSRQSKARRPYAHNRTATARKSEKNLDVVACCLAIVIRIEIKVFNLGNQRIARIGAGALIVKGLYLDSYYGREATSYDI